MLEERTILFIRKLQTDAHEIWQLSTDGRRLEVKACTSMERDGSIRSQLVLRVLGEKIIMCTQGGAMMTNLRGVGQSEIPACWHAYAFQRGISSRALLVVQFRGDLSLHCVLINAVMWIYAERFLSSSRVNATEFSRDFRGFLMVSRARVRTVGGAELANWRRLAYKRGCLRVWMKALMAEARWPIGERGLVKKKGFKILN